MKQMTTREVQQVCLDIMKDVHEFCVKNDIRYSLSGGSMLGAIRHNGFIPWDDDIDIEIPLPDYDRFIRSYKSERGYELFSREKDNNNDVYIRWSRICDMNSTYVEQGPYVWNKKNTGVWIDVLPLYAAPSNKEEFENYMKKFAKYIKYSHWLRFSKADISQRKYFKGRKKQLSFVIKKILGCFISNDYIDKCQRFLRKGSYSECKYVCASEHYGLGEWKPKQYVEDVTLHTFEDTQFYIMREYDKILRNLYGDYMQLPPEDKRGGHNKHPYFWK